MFGPPYVPLLLRLQPMVEQVPAIQNLLRQVDRNIEIMVRGFEAETRVAGLELIKAPGQPEFVAQDAVERGAGAWLFRCLAARELAAQRDEARLVGGAAEMDRGGFGDAAFGSKRLALGFGNVARK